MTWSYQVLSGDEAETQVLILARDANTSREIIVRLQASSSFPSDSIEDKAVACYHGFSVDNSYYTFPDRATMRNHVYAAVDVAWAQFILNADEEGRESGGVKLELYPDAVLQVEGVWSAALNKHLPHGKLVRETAQFERFVARFSRLSDIIPDGTCGVPTTLPFLSLDAITKEEPLGGRGTCTKVTAQLNNALIIGVMKGLSFFEYLAHSDGGIGEDRFTDELAAMNNEIKMVMCVLRLPHACPYIMGTPMALCTFDNTAPGGTTEAPRICAATFPFCEGGTLADAVARHKSAPSGGTISLPRLAKWCYQLTAAVYHTHTTCHTYHMDLKLDNILLDTAKDSILLIDWEQSGANSFSIAPEASKELDVILNPDTRLLEYTPFEGKRQNNPLGSPDWNVFPGWSKECPLAAELAEVYGLGCTIWALLAHYEFEFDEEDWRLEEREERWNELGHEVPDTWRLIVDRCIYPDPNMRIRLEELLGFWKKEAAEMGCLGVRGWDE